jgi:hypothetical protein
VNYTGAGVPLQAASLRQAAGELPITNPVDPEEYRAPGEKHPQHGTLLGRVAEGVAYTAQKAGLTRPDAGLIQDVERKFVGPGYTAGYTAPIGAEVRRSGSPDRNLVLTAVQIHSAPLGSTAPTLAPVAAVTDPRFNAAEPTITKIKVGDELGRTGNEQTTKPAHFGA